MDRKTLQTEIERLGFLDFVLKENLDKVRDGLLDNIISKQAFFFPHGEEYKNINGRLFSFDPESLTEGGAVNLFNCMRPSIEKAGLKITKAEQIFDFTANSRVPNYKLIINDRVCDLGIKVFLPFLLWGKVTKKFTLFLNGILKKNKIKERLYFMNDSCSDTEIAFLTPEQMRFINSLNLNPKDKVYSISSWTIWKPTFQIIGLIFGAIFRKKAKNA
ncbi:MAG: hypothetical protein ACTHLE_12950 [Agriterribacter sp.]